MSLKVAVPFARPYRREEMNMGRRKKPKKKPKPRLPPERGYRSSTAERKIQAHLPGRPCAMSHRGHTTGGCRLPGRCRRHLTPSTKKRKKRKKCVFHKMDLSWCVRAIPHWAGPVHRSHPDEWMNGPGGGGAAHQASTGASLANWSDRKNRSRWSLKAAWNLLRG